MAPQYCTTTEAAKIIGCTDSAVRVALRSGGIIGRRLGRDWIVLRSSAEKYRDRPKGPGRPRSLAV